MLAMAEVCKTWLVSQTMQVIVANTTRHGQNGGLTGGKTSMSVRLLLQIVRTKFSSTHSNTTANANFDLDCALHSALLGTDVLHQRRPPIPASLLPVSVSESTACTTQRTCTGSVFFSHDQLNPFQADLRVSSPTVYLLDQYTALGPTLILASVSR